MAIDPLHAFYCRKDFIDLAQMCKVKSGGVCAHCGKVFDISHLRAHHKIELTIDNVDNPQIALNPDNIEVLCYDCHNATHARFGFTVGQKHVYVVHGAPFAGKNTYVNTVATRNDIVVDLDAIHHAISVSSEYDKPVATKSMAFDIRNYLLDRIYTATLRRKWQDAYIIGMYADASERDELVRRYNAQLIHIDTPKAECIKRIYAKDLPIAKRDMLVGWVEEYFARFRA